MPAKGNRNVPGINNYSYKIPEFFFFFYSNPMQIKLSCAFTEKLAYFNVRDRNAKGKTLFFATVDDLILLKVSKGNTL